MIKLGLKFYLRLSQISLFVTIMFLTAVLRYSSSNRNIELQMYLQYASSSIFDNLFMIMFELVFF